MAVLNANEKMGLAYASQNVKRLLKAGYTDARLGTNTATVALFITDIETFRDSVAVNPASRPIFDAVVDSIRWLSRVDILTDVLMDAVTTVADITVAANTDLLYLITNHADYPDGGEGFSNLVNDLSVFQPAS